MYCVSIQCQECYCVTVKCYRVTVDVLLVTRWVLVIYTVLECALGVAVRARAFAYIDASLDLNTERSFDKWI